MKSNKNHRPRYVEGTFAWALMMAVMIVVSAYAGEPPAEAVSRQRISLDADWRFKLEPQVGLTDSVPIVKWRWKTDKQKGTDAANAQPAVDTSGPDWHDSESGDDNMNGAPSFRWFRTTLPTLAGPHRMIHFETVDNNCTVYLNGLKIAQHVGWNDPFDVPVDEGWNSDGQNTLALLVGNSPSLHGGITAAVTLGRQSLSPREADPITADFNDRDWRQLHLPHDYVAEGTYTSSAEAAHGSLPMTPAWYRKKFTLPASAAGQSVWIDFDGAYRDSIVYLNGKKLGEHQSGYTPFRYDISSIANFGGENQLAVRLDPRRFEGWFYEGGGIYRHVWLNIANPLHVAPFGTVVTAELPEPNSEGAVKPASIQIKTKLMNAGLAQAEGELVSRLIDDGGNTVAEVSSTGKIPAGGELEFTQQATVEHPKLWSLETPTLYKLQTLVKLNGSVVDTSDTRFGIRTERFDPDKGFFLNGKSVKIQGMCCHQDFAGVGIGIPDSLDYWRVKQLKQMGCNAWRMSHGPPNPALLDACDELGMLVMNENRHLGDTYTDHSVSGTKYTDPDDLATMIMRDRNHPSIIIWSLCNEEWLQGSREGQALFTAMMKTVQQYDTTRPISSAMNGGWFNPGFATVEDIIGFNYSPKEYDRFHKQHPKLAMYGSETSSSKMARGQYADDRQKSYATSYDVTNDSWRSVGERDFMAGSFGWTGIDYRGEARWPGISNQSGAMDLCGFPKDNFYYYQAWWTTEPVIHIMPHWNWPGREGQDIRVVVLSNCEHVEIFLNGVSQGSKDMPRFGHLEWSVKYAPGSVVAKGYNGATLTASQTVETTGAPSSLRLKTDRSTLVSDAEDVAPVEVDVLDEQGRIVPTADNRVTFRVEGAGSIVGVGNGDPVDHDSEKGNDRRAFSGKCLVIVGAMEKQGAIQLTASSPGLKSAVLTLGTSPARQ